jgi:8-oxo-dGTP pyrophosphatase MutT (NUDIX family)
VLLAVAAIVVRRGRILAMRRAPHKVGAGLWETLSGRVEPGEAPEEAAAREIEEESGLSVALDLRPIDAYRAFRGETPMVVIVYRARWIEGEVRRSSEHDDHAWLSLDEFTARSSLDRLALAIRRAISAT